MLGSIFVCINFEQHLEFLKINIRCHLVESYYIRLDPLIVKNSTISK